MQEKKDRFYKGAFALTLSVVIVKIIGFLYKLPLSYLLGDEGMGHFNAAYTVFGFFYLLCAGGVPRAVAILISEAKKNDGEARARIILKNCLCLFMLIGGILSLLLLIFSRAISNLIGNSMALSSIIAVCPSIFFISAAGVLRGYLNAEEKYTAIALSGVIEGGVKFVFGFALAYIGLYFDMGAPVISALTILGVTLGSLAMAAVLYICSKHDLHNEENHAYKLDRGITEKIFKIAAPLTLSAAVAGVSNLIDLGMIMHRLESIGYTETSATALYGNYTTLVVPMLGIVSALLTPICSAALPGIIKLRGENEKEQRIKRAGELLFFCAFFTIPLSFGFMMYSGEFLNILFDKGSAAVAAPSLVLIAPAVAIIGLLTMMNTQLEALGKTSVPLLSMGIGAIVKLVVSFVLIGTLNAVYTVPR